MNQKIHALYIRVSTESQAEEGFSITAQTQRLEAYATAMGWENRELFIDGGYSGSHLDRPEMNRLVEAVTQDRVQSVAVYKLDRLSRSQKDTLFLIEDVFLPHKVDFVSLNESIDTSTPYGRAMIGILSAFAQLERENIYQRTRMGMLERVKQGYWMGGGITPFGYDYDKEQGILVPNPTQAPIVGHVYDLYLKGYSPQKIAHLLGLQYDRLVMQIINRRSNLGPISYKGAEYQGRHLPLVSEEIFLKAQAKRISRQSGARAGGNHLLSGLIFCQQCGTRMRYLRWGKAGYKLRCYSQDPSKTYMTGDTKCTAPAVWAEEVESIVIGDLKQLSADLQGLSPHNTPINPIETLETQIIHQENKLKRLYHLYAQGEDDTLKSTIQECRTLLDNLKKAHKQETAHHHQTAHLALLQDKVATMAHSWQHLNFQQQQGILQDCVTGIHILGDRVEIHYNFMEKKQVPP